MTMSKKTVAVALASCIMLSLTACSGHSKPTVIQTMETFATTQNGTAAEQTESTSELADSMDIITLRGSGDDTYSFDYDSDIIVYSGQGGNFFLVGSSPTECYLHIMVLDGDETYDDAYSSAAGKIVEEYTLESGRRAFSYKTSDANTCHMIIDAKGIVSSGNGQIKITVGSADSWEYSLEQIANMVDKGF